MLHHLHSGAVDNEIHVRDQEHSPLHRPILGDTRYFPAGYSPFSGQELGQRLQLRVWRFHPIRSVQIHVVYPSESVRRRRDLSLPVHTVGDIGEIAGLVVSHENGRVSRCRPVRTGVRTARSPVLLIDEGPFRPAAVQHDFGEFGA